MQKLTSLMLHGCKKISQDGCHTIMPVFEIKLHREVTAPHWKSRLLPRVVQHKEARRTL